MAGLGFGVPDRRAGQPTIALGTVTHPRGWFAQPSVRAPRTGDDGSSTTVIGLAIVDDYEVVVAGVARMFDSYADRVAVVELDANQPVAADVDIAMYDTFAQGEADFET